MPILQNPVTGYTFVFLMGVILNLMGGGGALLTVPILVYCFEMSAVQAPEISLTLVGVVSAVATVKNIYSKKIFFVEALSLALPAALSLFVTRKWLLPSIPNEFQLFGSEKVFYRESFLLLFFCFVLLLAGSSLLGFWGKPNPPDSRPSEKRFYWKLAMAGLGVGIISGLTGAGGGFLFVPALISFGKFEIKSATENSLFVIAFQTLLGMLSTLSFEEFTSLVSSNPKFFIFAGLGFGTGAVFKPHIPAPILKKVFGGFLMALGAVIFLKNFR